MGRFAQADSIVPGAGQSQAWDRHAYTLNNPLLYTDPTGHDVDCEIGDTCSDARDLTNWTVAAAVDIAESAEMQAIADINANRSFDNISISITQAWSQFYNLVADGKKYDVKIKIEGELGQTIKLGDNWYEYSTAGNILYGFYGLATGFSEGELEAGAGVAQLLDHFLDEDHPPAGSPFTLFDTSDDYYAVQFGFFLYKNYYNDGELSVSEFTDAFRKFEHADKLALRPEPKTFWPRHFEYETNKFYNLY